MKKRGLLTFLKVLDGGSCKVIRKRENKLSCESENPLNWE